MSFKTADICDTHGDSVQYVDGGILQHYGGWTEFCGQIRTVKCSEDNAKVKEVLAQDGHGKVLVIDGGGSRKRALLGDLICKNAVPKGWMGIIINGCIRDAEAISNADLGVMAIGSNPRMTEAKNTGQIDVEVTFGSVCFKPGAYLYADKDGVVVSDTAIVDEAPGSPRDVPRGEVDTSCPGPFSPSWGRLTPPPSKL
eukprot:gnl/MRDRNA2_/MRDRNA2_98620_c0_seq1.p1 gnl/MRDRNA2_/MRDRNA2_98620_c0~~gnl/MRDRNA2_/MRDRNA2_98620_c0_seq1.p1  ORF type:complete len:198 (-),score=43.42 gnl/MRDRNA2_/MRDRNA2_98620_c0_seq1:274-867(-)